MTQSIGHPLTDPGDGRKECDVCGKWVFEAIHSCKGVPVTQAAWLRHRERTTAAAYLDASATTPDERGTGRRTK